MPPVNKWVSIVSSHNPAGFSDLAGGLDFGATGLGSDAPGLH